MILTPTIIGLLGGLVLGLVTFFSLGSVLSNMVRNGTSFDAPSVKVIDMMRKADLVILPALGAALGYFGILDGVLS